MMPDFFKGKSNEQFRIRILKCIRKINLCTTIPHKGDDIMKQNTKFLWIYTAILFSFALILILFAGLTQNNFQKELDEQATLSKGMEQSVSELTARNQQLSDEVKRLTGELEATKAQLEETSRLRTEVEDRFRIHEELDARLSKALWQRNDGNRSAARKTLDGVDRSTLTESQKYFYDRALR